MSKQRIQRSFPYASQKAVDQLSELIVEKNLYNQQKDAINMTRLYQQLQQRQDLKNQLMKHRTQEKNTTTQSKLFGSPLSFLKTVFGKKSKGTVYHTEQEEKAKTQVLKKVVGQMFQDALQVKDVKSLAQTNKQLSSSFFNVLDQYKDLLNTLDNFPSELISHLPRDRLHEFFQCQFTNEIMPDIHIKELSKLFDTHVYGQTYIFLRLFQKYFPDKTMMWYYRGMKKYDLIWRGRVGENNERAVLILQLHKSSNNKFIHQMYRLYVCTETVHGRHGIYCWCDGSLNDDQHDMATVIKKLIKSSLTDNASSVVINQCENNNTRQKIFNNIVFTPDKVRVNKQQYLSTGIKQKYLDRIQKFAQHIKV